MAVDPRSIDFGAPPYFRTRRVVNHRLEDRFSTLLMLSCYFATVSGNAQDNTQRPLGYTCQGFVLVLSNRSSQRQYFGVIQRYDFDT